MVGMLMQGDPPVLKSGLVFNAEPETNLHKRPYSSEAEQGDLARVYEGTYIHQFDHRL